jgi:hypothetical protein
VKPSPLRHKHLVLLSQKVAVSAPPGCAPGWPTPSARPGTTWRIGKSAQSICQPCAFSDLFGRLGRRAFIGTRNQKVILFLGAFDGSSQPAWLEATTNPGLRLVLRILVFGSHRCRPTSSIGWLFGRRRFDPRLKNPPGQQQSIHLTKGNRPRNNLVCLSFGIRSGLYSSELALRRLQLSYKSRLQKVRAIRHGRQEMRLQSPFGLRN